MALYLGNDGRLYDHDPGGGICLDSSAPAGQSPTRPQPSRPRPQPSQTRPWPPQTRTQPSQTRPRPSRPAVPVPAVSWQRKFCYWLFTLGGAFLLSLGTYIVFQNTLFRPEEADTLAGVLHRFMCGVAPLVLVAAGVLSTWGYGIMRADACHYNLKAYFWAGITCIFALTVAVFLLAIFPPVGAFVIPAFLIWQLIKIIWEVLTG